MSEIIYEIIKDADGVDCYIKRGKIVRCKNCKWWQDSEVGVVECPICTRIHDMVFEMGADGFCSKGEHREESEVEE